MNNIPRLSGRLHELIQLRTLVAVLGERLTPPWWRSQFLTHVGVRAISKIFPRTAISTAITSTVICAREDHDMHIGVGRRYHLFRLPTDLEPMVTEALMADSFGSEAMTLLNSPSDALLEALVVLASNCGVNPSGGPIKLGGPRLLSKGFGIKEMAAHYRASVETGRRVFPYFE